MSTVRRFLTSVAVCRSILPLAGGPAAAQETRATVSFTVRDASGGVLPGVPVVVTNDETTVTNQAGTNASGACEVPYLLPGTYTVTAQLDGFKKFTRTGSRRG